LYKLYLTSVLCIYFQYICKLTVANYMEKKQTNNGKKGGWLVGKRHYSKDGKPLGGIKAVVTDAGGKPVELEGGEVIINREASKKHWKELSRINQSAGNGVAIEPPSGAFDEDPEDNYEHGGKIDFNPNHVPSKMIVNYAKMIKSKHPKVWKLGGNIFGNEAFENLLRVSNRGYWIDSEEWMYIKWRSYVARHQRDYRIEGVVAMLKWCDKVGKGWPYMKKIIEEKIEKIDSKKGWKHKTSKMKEGGSTLGRTPAPLKDRIKGSKFNEKGSASTSSKASDIKFDDKTILSIQRLIDEHNDKHPSKKITLSVAKAVVRRGMGAYSSSHRPTISGGKPNSRTAWGLARLKAFIYKAQTGKSKSGKYSQDNDLFEELGISVQKMANGGEVEKGASESYNILMQHLDEYCQYHFNEHLDEDSFMIKTIKNGNGHKVQEVLGTTKSGKDVRISIDQLYMKNGGELAMGIKAEHEHSKTIDKFKRTGVSDLDVEMAIAKDHLKEDPHYYSKLLKMEQKFATGGTVTVNGVDYTIGDKGTYNGKVKESITIISISPKIVTYITPDGKKKGVYTEKFQKYFIADSSVGSTQVPIQPSSPLNVDERIKNAVEIFLKNGTLVLDLPPYLKYLAKLNQVKQGNKEADDVGLNFTKGIGNFDWFDSNEGEEFWTYVYEGDWTNPLILSVVGSKENLFLLPSQVQNKPQPQVPSETQPQVFKVGDKVKIPLTKAYGDSYGKSNSIQQAKQLGQDFLYVGAEPDSDGVIVLNYENEETGDFFDVIKDNIQLYEQPSVIQEQPITETKTQPTHKELSEVKTDRQLLLDEYNDVLFLIENTLGTDTDNMLSLKSKAKELKDNLDVLDLEIKKKNEGEINLLDTLFDASTIAPQERANLKPYNDGFAPDGQPTSLPKNIYEWTTTEEFQNWFGNFTLAYNYRNSSYANVPCSVVVNKNHEPLIVYHGTGGQFSFFKFDRFPAMYFAENEAYSNWFAELKGQEQGTRGYVYPFFLNIRMPLDLTGFEIDDVSGADFIDWMYLQTGLDADELKINKALLDPNRKFKAWMYLRNSPEMLQVLRDKNIFDGIIYYEDNPSVDSKSDAYKTKAYIIFNAHSAKIAEPNRHKLAIPAMRSFYLKRGGKV
jgi:hypothetical protein